MTPFTSNLSVNEHHAIRSVGFTPIGQVMGTCVWQTGKDVWNYDCVPGQGDVREVRDVYRSRYAGYRMAADRMRQECRDIGGDGVVAVQLKTARFFEGGVEVRAVGTAVRANGSVRPRRPFASDLTGQDFAKLVIAGFVPCDMVIAIAITLRHNDAMTPRQFALWRNVELEGYTDLVERARAAARSRLRDECIQSGGEGIVIRRMETAVHEQECSKGEDNLAEVLITGTAITQFRRGAAPTPLPIMRVTGGTDG